MGAILFFGLVSAVVAAFILYALQDAERFWFWSLSVPGVAGCAYFFAVALLYRVVCDGRHVLARNWYLAWEQHEWDDLASIFQNGLYGWAFRFNRTGFLEVPVY